MASLEGWNFTIKLCPREEINCREHTGLPSAFSLTRLLFLRSTSSYWAMKLVNLCFLFNMVSLASARADLTIVQKVEGMQESGQITIKIKGAKARIEASPQLTTIVDTKTGEMVNLMNNQKAAVRISSEKMKAAMETIRKFSGQGESAAKPKLTPTGKTETVNGYETVQYVYETPTFKATYWIAPNYPNASAILKEMEVLNSGAWKPRDMPLLDYSDFPGVPLKSVVTVNGNSVTTTVTAIKEDSLSDSEFAVPKDFQEVKPPEMQLSPNQATPAAGTSPEP
jgi:Domain of unknown function (DUF4412)